MKTTIIGIDNGLTGGIVAISAHTGEILHASSMPTKGIKPDEIHAQSVYHALSAIDPPEKCLVYLEKPVGSKSLNAAKSMASSFHTLRTVLEIKGFNYERVSPAWWQKPLLANIEGKDTKEKAEKLALELQPDYDFPTLRPTGKKLHDGVIDSYLISEFARRTLEL